MINKVDFNIIKEIQDKADIVAVISSFIKLTRKGNNYVGLCPFHPDRTPSLVVSPKKRIFKCFVCGAKGNVFGFVQQYKKVPFLEAVHIVATLINYDDSQLELKGNNTYLDPKIKRLFEANKQVNEWYQGFLNNDENHEYLDYLHKRGLDDQVIKQFQFGYAPREKDIIYRMASNDKQMFGSNRDVALIWNEQELSEAGLIIINEEGNAYDFLIDRITIPIYDNNGYLAGFSGRTIKANAQQKYLNTSTTKIFAKGNILFNFFNVRQTSASQVIIVEGYMDAIAYCRAGHNNVVATMGVALSDEHINILKTLNSLDSVILSFDNDVAGIQATITNGYKLMENGINTFVVGKAMQDIKDVDELYTRSGKEEVDKILEEQRDFISFLIEQSFQPKMPLNEIQKVTNTIIKNMIDFDDTSLLWKTKHLQLLAEKSQIAYDDLLTKYNSEFQKLTVKETNLTKSTKSFPSPYKPTNTIGLKETFLETKDIEEGKIIPKSKIQEMYDTVTNRLKLMTKKLTECYDYIIETIINKPDLLNRFNDELWRSSELEFKEQQTVIKAIHVLADRHAIINEVSILEFLQTNSHQAGKVGLEYERAYTYLSYRLNLPYYLQLIKQKINTKGEQQFVDAIRELQLTKYELKIMIRQKCALDLYIKDSQGNKDEINKLFGEVNGYRKELNDLLKSIDKQRKLH